MDLYARYGHSDGPDDTSLGQRIADLEDRMEKMAQGQTDLQQQIDILKTNVTALVENQQAVIDRLVAAHDAENDAAFASEAQQLREINSRLSNFGTQVQPATTRQDANQTAPAGGSGIGPTSAPLPGTAGPTPGEAPASAQPATPADAATAQSRSPNGEPL